MKTFLSLSLLLSSVFVLAQPTLTSSMGAVVGETYSGSILVDTTGIMPGNAGANQTWNFANLTTTGTTSGSTIVLPSSTPYASTFPGATIAGVAGGAYAYVKLSSTKMEDVGTVNGSQTMVFSDYRTNLEFPFTFNSSYTDTQAGAITTGGTNMNRTGSVTATADAWGTLVTPSGTYNNTLRVKYIEQFTDVGGGFNILADVTIYIWYSPNYKQPLFTIYEQNYTIFGQVTHSKAVYYADTPLAVGTDNALLAKSLSLYPNPAQDKVNLTFDANLSYKNVRISLLTLEGKEIMKEEISEMLPSKFETELSLVGLSKGMYIIKISADDFSPICKKLYVD